MAIQIIDNFSLNAERPIDNRFVVGPGNFYSDKNDITNKYEGLRIWDLNDNFPYVWNGTSWISENTLGISGSGAVNRVAKFTSSNVIANSQIFDNGTNVGIGTTTPTNKLSVNGNLSATNFIGNGSQLNSLNANNITSGNLTFNRLPIGGSSALLLGFNSWINPNTLSVNSATTATTATNANNVNIQSTTTNNNNHYVLFSTGTGDQPIRTNTSNSIRINPSTGNIGINTSSMNNNKLTVIGNVSIGFTTTAPVNGLRVNGQTILNGLQISGDGNASISNHNIYISGNGGVFTNGAHIDFDKTTSGTFNPRFFRHTNTTGIKAVALHRGNNTNTIDIQLGVDETPTFFRRKTNNEDIIRFLNSSGTQRGAIEGDGVNNVNYETSSDLRLKKEISDIGSMIEKIKMLKPSKYKWKSDNSSGFGFIAQQVFSVFPELRKDMTGLYVNDDLDNPIGKDGEPYYYGLDYGRFTPFLTKALQEVIQNYEDLIDKIKNSDSLEDLKGNL